MLEITLQDGKDIDKKNHVFEESLHEVKMIKTTSD